MGYERKTLDAVRVIRARGIEAGAWLRSARWKHDRKVARIDRRGQAVVLAEPRRGTLMQIPALRTLPEDVHVIDARDANRAKEATDAA